MKRFSTLVKTRQPMPMAHLGPPCPMPRFRWQQPIATQRTHPVGLTEEESLNSFDWGQDSILPYQIQDSYNRTLTDSDLEIITLENDRFLARIAPSLGGRLLGLRDKAQEKDLIFQNPVFQPANLAALNAWFSGGIEWNGLTPGHSPTTCSPVFSDRVDTERGPVLRIYEFDRIAEAVWQISLFLPPGDAPLTIHGQIINPNPTPTQIYWWTNIAVPAFPNIRILSAADYSIEHVLPDNHLEHFDFPFRNGLDGSYPRNWQGSTSVFFRSARKVRPFIVAIDAQGHGVAHISSNELIGRKFFYFGTAPGGQHWMDFLSRPGKGDYVEIQAGLMPTQNQRYNLPAHARTHWTSVVLPIKLDPETAHHTDYQHATGMAETILHTQMPQKTLADLDQFLRAVSPRPATAQLSHGSPWGRRHQAMTGHPLAEGPDFSSPNPDDFWDYVARGADFPEGWDHSLPEGFGVSSRWVTALEASARRVSPEKDWLHPLFLSIAALDRNARSQAAQLAELSLGRRPNWLAYRQRALLADTPDEATQAYYNAWRTGEAPLSLAVEIVSHLQHHNRPQDLGPFLAGLGPVAQTHERLVLALAHEAAQHGDPDSLARHLVREFATIREGETITTDLWNTLQRLTLQQRLGRSPDPEEMKRHLQNNPPPLCLDFRMVAPPSEDSGQTSHHSPSTL